MPQQLKSASRDPNNINLLLELFQTATLFNMILYYCLCNTFRKLWNYFSNSIGPEDSKGAVYTQLTTQNVKFLRTHPPIITSSVFPLAWKKYTCCQGIMSKTPFQNHPPIDNVNLTFCVDTWVWSAPLNLGVSNFLRIFQNF